MDKGPDGHFGWGQTSLMMILQFKVCVHLAVIKEPGVPHDNHDNGEDILLDTSTGFMYSKVTQQFMSNNLVRTYIKSVAAVALLLLRGAVSLSFISTNWGTISMHKVTER